MYRGIGEAMIGFLYLAVAIGLIVGAAIGIGLWLLIPWLWHHIAWI